VLQAGRIFPLFQSHEIENICPILETVLRADFEKIGYLKIVHSPRKGGQFPFLFIQFPISK
jgi:hypothetical protein